jgi:RNA polymerase sigma-54 factor
MDLKPTLKTAPAVSQQLVLSPRLYQSLRILRLGAHELQEVVQKELDENPTLEIPEPADYDLEATPSPERELWEDYLGAHRGERGGGDDSTAAAVELAASPETLTDHLTLQLDLENLTDKQRRIGLAIIGSLDEDGYLREPVEELAHTVDLSATAIEKVLAVVQRFDPPGVAARNLEECLAIQLEQMDAGATAVRVAREFLPQVARGAVAEIAKSLGVTTGKIKRTIELIRKLTPSPGSLFDTSPPAAPVIPDVFARPDRGRVRILANRGIMPSLRLSRVYQQMAIAAKDQAAGGIGKAAADPETARYIKEKLQEASRLIRDIDHRRTTVTKVARAIAESQPEFFRKGPGYLRPLGLEEIASRLEVHPSTVSRAILGKYMSTPYGVFEFRYFFSAGYATTGGEGLSATAVKQRLAGLVAQEDTRRPLSDQKLAGLLQENGLSISRRTVAKYREALGIPASWERKQSQ